MQELVIVNASHVISDTEISVAARALQRQINEHFLPEWQPHGVPSVRVSCAKMQDIPQLDPAAWAIFVNKHSIDPGALGWHDDRGERVFSRVFAGDCVKFALRWSVTLSHEALEMLLDPDIRRIFRLKDGRLVAVEACDPVESDDQAYEIDGVLLSNFLLPAYYSGSAAGPFDYRGVLTKPCPSLSPGGYISIQAQDGSWGQVYANKSDGCASRRALLRGFRRSVRLQQWQTRPLEVWRDAGVE